MFAIVLGNVVFTGATADVEPSFTADVYVGAELWLRLSKQKARPWVWLDVQADAYENLQKMIARHNVLTGHALTIEALADLLTKTIVLPGWYAARLLELKAMTNEFVIFTLTGRVGVFAIEEPYDASKLQQYHARYPGIIKILNAVDPEEALHILSSSPIHKLQDPNA